MHGKRGVEAGDGEDLFHHGWNGAEADSSRQRLESPGNCQQDPQPGAADILQSAEIDNQRSLSLLHPLSTGRFEFGGGDRIHAPLYLDNIGIARFFALYLHWHIPPLKKRSFAQTTHPAGFFNMNWPTRKSLKRGCLRRRHRRCRRHRHRHLSNHRQGIDLRHYQ